MRLYVIGIALKYVLGFGYRIANSARTTVELSQGGVQVFGSRIGSDSQLVLVDGFVGIFRPPIHGRHLFIQSGHRGVIVRSSVVGLLGLCRRRRFWLRRRRR